MTVFSTVWVSGSSADQRAGRASRTRPGVCWRLYTEEFLNTQLPAHTLCEMRRTALEDLVLQLRLLDLGDDAGEFLLRAPEPPTRDAVIAAVDSLISIGAMLNTVGHPLTALGFHLANMPVDVRVGKMLVYGALCGCLSPILTIAACLAHKSPFTRNFNRLREEEQRKAREARYGHLCSDHLAAAEVFKDYKEICNQGSTAIRTFCDELGLSSTVMSNITQLRQRFLHHLVDIGLASSSVQSGKKDASISRDSDFALVRCVLCAGLFPNVAQVQRQGKNNGIKVNFVTREQERCSVHPSSINVGPKQQDFAANSAWLLFHAKVKTSQIFVQDSTLIGNLPLLLFGGELSIIRELSRTFIVVNGLRFRTRKLETAVLLKMLRRELDVLLAAKVANPNTDISEASAAVMATLMQLLSVDGSCVSGKFRS